MGRNTELATLSAFLHESPTPSLVLVSGGAGIGKTRLIEEFSRMAHAAGWQVHRGSCGPEGSEPAYGPWTAIFRSLLGGDVDDGLEALLLEIGGTNDRLDLFDEAALALARAAVEQPRLIVLDDLHTAGIPTLLLAKFLADQLAGVPAIVLAASRSVEQLDAAANREQIELIAASAHQVSLTGLSVEDIGGLVSHHAVVREIYSRTEGNPLFIEQFIRMAGVIDITPPTADPNSLLSLTQGRIARLHESTRATLGALAVIGGRATSVQLGYVLNVLAADVDRALAPVVGDAVRVVSDLAQEYYVFSHAIYAEASTVTGARAENYHARAADLVGAVGRESELASHLLEAGPGYAARAANAYLTAGDASFSALAYEDAVEYYIRADALYAKLPHPSTPNRVRTLVGLGRVRARLGNHDGARAAFDDAWRWAQAEPPSIIALAALGPELGFGFVTADQLEREERCRHALDRVGAAPTPMRAMLLASLATHQLSTREPAVARASAEEAHACARQCGDPLSLGAALVALSVTDLGPDTMEHRITMAHRILALAGELGEPAYARTGHFLLMGALLERGDVRALDAELASRHRQSAGFSTLESGRHTAWFRCMRAILDGRIPEAERLAGEALATAQREGDADALSVYVGQLGVIRWLQGREGEVESLYLAARQEQPTEAVWGAVLARLWALEGREHAALGAINALGDLSLIPRDRNWLLTMSTLAEAVAVLGDSDRAAQLRDQLLPHFSRMVPIGLGIACWGTVARPLALLSACLGRSAEAIAHYRHAMTLCSEAGALPWLAQIQCELARLIHGDDPAEATLMVSEAQMTIDRLNIVALVPTLDAAREIITTPDTLAELPHPSPDSPRRPIVRVLGTFEVIGVSGHPTAWTSRKARELLKLLVSRRGAAVTRETIMHALWPDEDPRSLSNRLSVAITTVRRAFDPDRIRPADEFLATDNVSLHLRVDRMEIDAEEFLRLAKDVGAEAHLGDVRALKLAAEAFHGEALPDEPYAPWASAFRGEVQERFARVARALGERAEQDGDDLLAVDTYRRLLVEDPFDELAHLGLIRALSRLGAYGRASAAEREYRAKMDELGLGPTEP